MQYVGLSTRRLARDSDDQILWDGLTYLDHLGRVHHWLTFATTRDLHMTLTNLSSKLLIEKVVNLVNWLRQRFLWAIFDHGISGSPQSWTQPVTCPMSRCADTADQRGQGPSLPTNIVIHFRPKHKYSVYHKSQRIFSKGLTFPFLRAYSWGHQSLLFREEAFCGGYGDKQGDFVGRTVQWVTLFRRIKIHTTCRFGKHGSFWTLSATYALWSMDSNAWTDRIGKDGFVGLLRGFQTYFQQFKP